MSDTPIAASADRPPVAAWLSVLRTIRAPFAVLAIAALGLLLPPQTTDMLAAMKGAAVRWQNPTLTFHLALAALSFSSWYWARAVLSARFDVAGTIAARNRFHQVRRRAFDWAPRYLFLFSVLLGIGLLARSSDWSDLPFLVLWAVPLGAFVVFRLQIKEWIGRCLRRQPATPEPLAEESAGGIPNSDDWCFWLRSLKPRLSLLLHRAPLARWLAIVLIMLGSLAFVYGAVETFVPWDAFGGPPGVPRYPGSPQFVAEIFTGPSAALIGFAVMIAPLAVLTFLFDGLRLPALRSFSLRRPPVITLLLAWILIASSVASLHVVRLVPHPERGVQIGQRHTLEDFFLGWAEACQKVSDPAHPPPAYPIIVAVSGGASRAAIWGARVLAEIEKDTGPGRPAVFAVSSVSGGSLGAAAYMSLLAPLPDDQRCSSADAARKSRLEFLNSPRLARDALGPLLAGTLLWDVPRALFSPFAKTARWLTGRDPRGGDRAEAIERAFERLWRKEPAAEPDSEPDRVDFAEPFLSLFYNDAGEPRVGMPLWIVNGTDLTSGNRALTVPITPHSEGMAQKRTWPFRAASDVLGELDADVPISTAINNSARFPYLEPTGELLRYMPPGSKGPPPLDQTRPLEDSSSQLLDGGYFENEGLQTALDLAEWLSEYGPGVIGRQVQPIIVQATADSTVGFTADDIVRCNSPEDATDKSLNTGRPMQLTAPLLELYNVRGAHSAVLLRAARDAYCPNQAFFHFYLPAQGTTEVPLNWTLSDQVARFIWNAMDAKGSGNTAEHESLARKLQAW